MSDQPRSPWVRSGEPEGEGAAGEGLEAAEQTQPLHRPAARPAPAHPGELYPQYAPSRRVAEPEEPEFVGLREDPERSVGWGKAVAALLGAVAVLGALYVGLAYWAGTHVPQNTHVRGADIGGATRSDAESTLRTRVAQAVSAPVKVRAGEQEILIDPAAAGLAVDYDATLEGVTGVSFQPRVVWERLTGNGSDRPLRIKVDEAKLRAALAEKGSAFAVPAREGTVALTHGVVETTQAEKGTRLDVEATAAVVEQSWPTERPVPASLTSVDPAVSQGEIDRFVSETGNTVVSGPVKLKVGTQTVTLDRGKITQVTSVAAKDGKLGLTVDEDGLLSLVRAAAPKAEPAPVNATLTLKSGKPHITPDKPGKQIDRASLTREFTAAVTRATAREGTVRLTERKPSMTTAQLKGMNLRTPMSEFRSRFPGGPENAARTHNIRRALTYVDGKVIKPGEQFSLLKTLGKMDASQGYVKAGVIINGMPAEAMAGGLSQVSTVVYNASYFAGVQLDAHTAHSYYISRYPAGREATIWSGQIDNKWTNNTPTPIIIEAHIEGDEVVMRFWGTRVYDVKSVSSERYAITQPTTRLNPAANCEADHGTDVGFSITVTRILSKDGKVVKREPVTTTYIPADDVTCTNPQAPGYGK